MTQTFEEKVAQLITKNKGYPPGIERTERIRRIDEMLDEYVTQKGEAPPSDVLETLANEILADELRDKDPDKVTNNDYPFLSESQFEVRHGKEVSDTINAVRGTDGKDYRVPTRRKRNAYENNRIDRRAKIRNQERKAQYRRDTSPGPVVTYTMSPEDATAYLTEKYGRKLA
ncbi:hypothetical protein [Aneurinibacillus migulanus]|uniref:hypothetical protein n=1 Tax=Aneurinibacillus migulanus TaxID=47500 RepID=UPI0020A1FCF3|nr:hypothetical protein [Aneurinibacillus migulanus]MCP1354645.1 hypothetical protein [Aneurinibacillus migulanus]